MWLYISIAVLLAIPAVVLWPGIRGNRRVGEDHGREDNIRVGRRRLAELDPESLSYQDDKSAIEAELLDDLNKQDMDIQSTRPIGIPISIVICLLIPVGGFAGYYYLGKQAGLFSSPPISIESTLADLELDPGDQETLSLLLVRLEQVLDKRPDDIEGWTLAARTYMSIRQYGKAINAYANLNRLRPGVPEILTGFADALILENGNQYTDQARALVAEALDVDPKNPNALWMSAIGDFTAGDRDRALVRLETLKDLVADDITSVQRVDQMIAAILREQPVSTQPSEEDQAGVAGFTTGIEVRLTVDEGISLPPDTAVFVVARGTDGIPAPVAVARLTAGDLPVTVNLNDSHAMIPSRTLSRMQEISVSARTSADGTVAVTASDLITQTVLFSTADSSVVELELKARPKD
ncbi:MAG: c-type cytochrome biogenesis protein CcmI [Pseudomonadota bacterium]